MKNTVKSKGQSLVIDHKEGQNNFLKGKEMQKTYKVLAKEGLVTGDILGDLLYSLDFHINQALEKVQRYKVYKNTLRDAELRNYAKKLEKEQKGNSQKFEGFWNHVFSLIAIKTSCNDQTLSRAKEKCLNQPENSRIIICELLLTIYPENSNDRNNSDNMPLLLSVKTCKSIYESLKISNWVIRENTTDKTVGNEFD